MKEDETKPHFAALRASHRSLASCPGYTDSHGAWNTGFQCPKWAGEDEEYCCGDVTKRFCCPQPQKPKHHSHNDGSRKRGGSKSGDGGKRGRSGERGGGINRSSSNGSGGRDYGDRNKGTKGSSNRKNDRNYDGRHIGDGDSGQYRSNDKYSNIQNNSGLIDRRPITDELIGSGGTTSSPSYHVTHSINNNNLQLPIIPLVLTLSIASCIFLLISVVVCCCYCSCCVVKRRRNKGKDNYIKTTSVNLEAEVTSAAIAAQALVMMPASDSFNNNYNNTPNNLYNNNNSNISNNTLSTTSSMSAVYNNIACRGPTSMQGTRGSPAMTNNSSEVPTDPHHSKLNLPHIDNNFHLDPHTHQDSYTRQPLVVDTTTPILNARDHSLHWQELEAMLTSQGRSRIHDNSMDQLSSSITNWLPLSKSQIGGQDACIDQWVSENNNNNNNDNMNNNKKLNNSSSIQNNIHNNILKGMDSVMINTNDNNNNIKNQKGNVSDFNSLNTKISNCSISFHSSPSNRINQSHNTISPFPDVTQTSSFNPGVVNKSPNNNNNNKIKSFTSSNNNNSTTFNPNNITFNPNNTTFNSSNNYSSLKLNENQSNKNNSPYKINTDEHMQTDTQTHIQTDTQTDTDSNTFSPKPSLPDIPDCPQLKLTSTWMAMR